MRQAVTGAFGYSGKYIAQRLLKKGIEVITLTDSPQRKHDFGTSIQAYPFHVAILGAILGKQRPIFSIPDFFGYAAGKIVGLIFDDVVITRDEIQGLCADLLYVDAPPAGNTKLTDWAREHVDELGLRYASELARRRDRTRAYQ
ncbi:MAG TPA: hypothetical protein PLI09_05150 [Candidatus Hydrogenedentes bacterium]|nr:hypothetical protein [Candidatus Hydrogenedentota bacterium]